MKNDIINIALANPRGFCAGVERAIVIVEKALKKFGSPIYVRLEVVHNKFVIEDLKKKGAIFVDDIDEIPKGSHVIFSAHGVSKTVKRDAAKHNLTPIDATCPLVTKVHREVNQMYDKNYHIQNSYFFNFCINKLFIISKLPGYGRICTGFISRTNPWCK